MSLGLLSHTKNLIYRWSQHETNLEPQLLPQNLPSRNCLETESYWWSSYRKVQLPLIPWDTEYDEMKTDDEGNTLMAVLERYFGHGDQRQLDHAWNQHLQSHESYAVEPNVKDSTHVAKWHSYVDEANLKRVNRRTGFGYEPCTHLQNWATIASRIYNSINALDLDLVFPIEQNFESSTTRTALKAALAIIASFTAIIARQYNPQRVLVGISDQKYLFQLHGHIETLLAPSAPMFVTSCATYCSATILLHHLHSHDPYQNHFIIAGALCGLIIDLRSENWISVGRNVPIFIAIAMILSIVRHGFLEIFPMLGASKLLTAMEFRRQLVVGRIGRARNLVGLKRSSDYLPRRDADC